MKRIYVRCIPGSEYFFGLLGCDPSIHNERGYPFWMEDQVMLVLSRKVGQRLVIDDNITIVINRITGNRVQIGIEAPDDVHIMRGELDKIRRKLTDNEVTPVTSTAPTE